MQMLNEIVKRMPNFQKGGDVTKDDELNKNKEVSEATKKEEELSEATKEDGGELSED